MSNVFGYAAFTFGKSFNLSGIQSRYGDGMEAKVVSAFQGVPVAPAGTLEESALSMAEALAAGAGLSVRAKAANGLHVALYEGSDCIGFVELDVQAGDPSLSMANGDTAGNLRTYSFKGIRRLEKAA